MFIYFRWFVQATLPPALPSLSVGVNCNPFLLLLDFVQHAEYKCAIHSSNLDKNQSMSDVKKLSQLEYFIALTQWTSFRWANERNVFLLTLKQTPNKWTRAWDKHRHSILIFQIRILFSTLIPSFLFTYHRSLRMCLWIDFTVNYYYSLLFVFFELCRSCRWAKNITAYWIDGMKLCRSTQSTDERKRMNQREYERFYVWLTATSTYGCVSTFKVAMEIRKMLLENWYILNEWNSLKMDPFFCYQSINVTLKLI